MDKKIISLVLMSLGLVITSCGINNGNSSENNSS